MSARTRLATALADALPATVQIVDDVRDLGEWDPSNTVVVQLITQKVTPEPRLQAVAFEIAAWVVVPQNDPEERGPGELEAALEGALEDVINALLPLGDISWSSAEREVHPSGFHGFRITITVYSTITP